MDSDKFVDLIRPQSGCELAASMPFAMFQGLCERTSDVCIGCAYNPCERMNADTRSQKEIRKANFGKVDFETNAEIAKRLNISARQVSKMRRKREIR